MEQQLVVFSLGKEEFGVDISRVREIVRLHNITAIPQSAEFVEGLVNLHGQIVPIVDLCKRFLMSEKTDRENAAEQRIIVLHIQERSIGILVDGVSEILRIADESIEPPPPIVANSAGAEFIRGIAKVADRLIVMLDLERMFSSEEQDVFEAAVENAAAVG